jgi:hypothetical protein
MVGVLFPIFYVTRLGMVNTLVSGMTYGVEKSHLSIFFSNSIPLLETRRPLCLIIWTYLVPITIGILVSLGLPMIGDWNLLTLFLVSCIPQRCIRGKWIACCGVPLAAIGLL